VVYVYHKYKRDLYDLYSIPNIFQVIKSGRMRYAGHVAWMWEGWSADRVWVGKPEWRRPLCSPRHRWEDNIKMNLEKWDVGHGLDW